MHDNVRFTVHHILSEADAGWPGFRGQLRDELFEQFVPSSYAESSTLLCVCGPSPFTQEFLRSIFVLFLRFIYFVIISFFWIFTRFIVFGLFSHV